MAVFSLFSDSVICILHGILFLTLVWNHHRHYIGRCNRQTTTNIPCVLLHVYTARTHARTHTHTHARSPAGLIRKPAGHLARKVTLTGAMGSQCAQGDTHVSMQVNMRTLGRRVHRHAAPSEPNLTVQGRISLV